MNIRELLDDDVFFKTLFDVIPVLALIVNQESEVFAINDAGKNLFGIDPNEVYLHRSGDVFNCIYRNDDLRGCGFGQKCADCIVRKSAMAAINGGKVQRAKGKLEIEQNNEYRLLNLLVSSVPMEYKGIKMAVVIIEDVSKITELAGLIPICASCKQIRDDQGYWTRMEKFIEENSEAEFTHDLCPKCIDALTIKKWQKKLG